MNKELIQTGNFKERGRELFGRTGLIDLDYINNNVLNTDIVPKSYKIIMNDFESYGFFALNVIKDNDDLTLFCKYDQIEKEASKIKDNKDFFLNSKNNFWWDSFNNWMILPSSKTKIFYNSIIYDYMNWWMQRPEIERNHDYNEALKKLTKHN